VRAFDKDGDIAMTSCTLFNNDDQFHARAAVAFVVRRSLRSTTGNETEFLEGESV
jgi:hypothetical protein